MDTQRLILLLIFSFSVFLLVDAWQKEQRGETPPVSTAQTATPGSEAGSGTPTPVPTTRLEAPSSGVPKPSGSAPAPVTSELVTVTTDVFDLRIDPRGGSIVRVELLRHGGVLDKSKPFVLLQRGPDHTYVAQSGLIGDKLPNHNSLYVPAERSYRLSQGQDVLEVRLMAPADAGMAVTKVLTFRRGSYVVDVTYELRNETGDPKEVFAYYQFLRDDKAPEGDSVMMPTYTGAAVYTEAEKYQKVSFSDIEKGRTPYPKVADNGWIAIIQHYFLGAVIPPANIQREFYTRMLDGGLMSAGVILPVGTVQTGDAAQQSVKLYLGPQDQARLAELSPGLELTVDYGWLTIIAAPLFWVLKSIHGWVANWGVAIILLTVLIKAIFYPLSAASYRSMAKMRVLAPKLQRLKEQYGDDRQRMHQAMMEMYKTEKINPLGGCLPILVQIPVFIALYWVLLASVELRNAPFMLWIDDLSVPDPFFILPVLMGATMIIQTRLNPEPPDPIQAKVMKIMPIVFSIFFFFFPAGLVLYWLVNNILSIAQQWHITRAMERAAAAHGRR